MEEPKVITIGDVIDSTAVMHVNDFLDLYLYLYLYLYSNPANSNEYILLIMLGK